MCDVVVFPAITVLSCLCGRVNEPDEVVSPSSALQLRSAGTADTGGVAT